MKRVMICEDDPIQAIGLLEEVESAGADICGCFEDSTEAWRAAQLLKPDIAIVDLSLADGNTGVDLALKLVGLGCRVVVLTGSTDQHPALGRISHCFVAKPIPPGAIFELTKG